MTTRPWKHTTETMGREGPRVLTVSVQNIAASPDNTRLFDTMDADEIANMDGIDVAVLCAYTLTTAHVDHEAVGQVITRHGLRSFPSPEPTPSARQIESLRAIEPVAVVRYTLEALLLTQARRARDYDPGAVTADPVLALYLPGHAPDTTDGVA